MHMSYHLYPLLRHKLTAIHSLISREATEKRGFHKPPLHQQLANLIGQQPKPAADNDSRQLHCCIVSLVDILLASRKGWIVCFISIYICSMY